MTADKKDFYNPIRERIVRSLVIWPFISHTQLQIALGTSLPSDIWVPIFKELCDEGVVEIVHASIKTATGRNQKIKVIMLKNDELKAWYTERLAEIKADEDSEPETEDNSDPNPNQTKPAPETPVLDPEFESSANI